MDGKATYTVDGSGVNDISSAPKFALYALSHALKHPRTPIRYLRCPVCGVRVVSEDGRCPNCGNTARNPGGPGSRHPNDEPQVKEVSPLPWYASVFIILMGVICWGVGAGVPIPGLEEAGRAMVYIPLGNLFGMSINR